MAKRLPPYDPAGKCPKCGGEEVRTRYCPGEGVSWEYAGQCKAAREALGIGVAPDYNYGKRVPEHLHRACQRCSFSWLEACVKQEKPAPVKQSPPLAHFGEPGLPRVPPTREEIDRERWRSKGGELVIP